MTKSKEIIYDQFQAGIAFSKYMTKGFGDLNNVDILSQLGTAQCNFALVKDSGSSITEGVLPCVTKLGNIYWFSVSSGKIWNRSTSGIYSTLSNNSYGKHYDADFFDNWVYYASQTNLGRFAVDGSSRNDGFHGFNNSGSPYHPMCALNNILFIGDGASLASINTSAAFSKQAIQLQSHYNIACIKPYGYYIAMFTNVSQQYLKAGVFLYDTSSAAWSSEDYIDETGFNVAIASATSDEIFVLGGNTGDIYLFDGVKMDWANKVQGITQMSTGNKLAVCIGRKSFFSTGTGVIYSLSHPLPGGQAVLNKEYVVSGGAGATVYSMCSYNGQIFVSWSLGGTYGVDTVGTTYTTATLDTPLYMGRVTTVAVGYESLPAGTSIGISIKKDDGDWTSVAVKTDTITRTVYTAQDVGNNNFVQARVTLNPNNSGTPATPIIQYIQFL